MYHHKMVYDYSKLEEEQHPQDAPGKFTGYAYLFDENDKFIEMSVFENGEEKYSSVKQSERARVEYYPLTVCTHWYQRVCSPSGCEPWTELRIDCDIVYLSSSSGSGSGSGGGSLNTHVTLVSGGGSGTVSNLNMFSDIPGYVQWVTGLTLSEQNFFKRKFWLVPYAIASYLDANFFTQLFYCRNDDAGSWNAFKHAFWSAMNAMYMGSHNALELAAAHEEGSHPLSAQMDMFNNNKGIMLYNANSSTLHNWADVGRLYINIAFLANKASEMTGAGQLRRFNALGNGLDPTHNNDRCL